MPRYYVSHRNEHGLTPFMDSRGYDSMQGAQDECLVSAKQMIGDWLRAGMPLSHALNQSFEVADDAGHIVLTVPFFAALEADTRGKSGVVEKPRGT